MDAPCIAILFYALLAGCLLSLGSANAVLFLFAVFVQLVVWDLLWGMRLLTLIMIRAAYLARFVGVIFRSHPDMPYVYVWLYQDVVYAALFSCILSGLLLLFVCFVVYTFLQPFPRCLCFFVRQRAARLGPLDAACC